MVFPAVTYLLSMLLTAGTSVSAKGLSHPAPGILATYQFEASEPSLEKVYGWAKKTFRRTEPVRLDNALAIPVCFSAGRKAGVMTCTVTVLVTHQGYELTITNAYHIGNGWVEDKGNITQPNALLNWHLTKLRHAFEEWLTQDRERQAHPRPTAPYRGRTL